MCILRERAEDMALCTVSVHLHSTLGDNAEVQKLEAAAVQQLSTEDKPAALLELHQRLMSAAC